MTDRERIVKLETAQKLVEEVRNSLSLESSVCQSCGLVKHENFDQYQIKEQLTGAINRIAKTRERIQHD
jgi:hypothetical protein